MCLESIFRARTQRELFKHSRSRFIPFDVVPLLFIWAREAALGLAHLLFCFAFFLVECEGCVRANRSTLVVSFLDREDAVL
jgi:hypothetical protein